MFDSQKRTFDIDLIRIDPAVQGNFPNRILMGLVGDASICNKDIDRAEPVSGTGDTRRNRSLVGYIALDCMERRAKRFLNRSAVVRRDQTALVYEMLKWLSRQEEALSHSETQ